MNKIGKEATKKIQETQTKILSLANISVNKLINPAAKLTLELLKKPPAEGSKIHNVWKQIEFNEIEEKYLKPMEDLGQWLHSSHSEMEKTIEKEHGINPNDWLFSKNNVELLFKFQEYADNCFEELKNEPIPALFRNLNILASLQSCYYSYLMIINIESVLEKNAQNLELIDELKYTLKYANAVYGSSTDVITYIKNKTDIKTFNQVQTIENDFLKLTGQKYEDIVTANWNSSPHSPAYCMTIDRNSKNIILTVRGSNDWADVLTDIDLESVKLELKQDISGYRYLDFIDSVSLGNEYYIKSTYELSENTNVENNSTCLISGFCHRGMMKAALTLYKEIIMSVDKLFSEEKFSDYSLKITGHSLGGGVSNLLTLLLLLHPPNSLSKNISKKIKCYTFGSASVLSENFDYLLKENVYSVICFKDIVPRLCAGSMKNFVKLLGQIKELDVSFSISFKMQSNEKIFPNSIIPFVNLKENYEYIGIYKELKEKVQTSENLLPSGKVLFIQSLQSAVKQELNCVFEIRDKSLFSEIILLEGCITSHFSENYVKKLSNVKSSPKNFRTSLN